jgi:predicted AAA+ superfamily ATPase
MVQQIVIQRVIDYQKQRNNRFGTGLQRELLPDLPSLQSHALIVSGIRRCGKSTLLKQLLEKEQKKVLFLNFDDPRLSNFELSDFELLDEIIKNNRYEVLFFDEIQVIDKWELYIRQKLDEGFRVVVTGSNASLLSRELGTKLTGRHISKELFPFSYREFLQFKNFEASDKSFQKYADLGGFPELLKTNNADVLAELFENILTRDIIVRYGIRDAKLLKNLAVYLISNAGNLVTANKLAPALGAKTTTTILEYFSFLENTYLISFLPKFGYSIKAQMVNPKKVYVIDSGLLQVTSNSFRDDKGHILENMVFCELKRRRKNLFYFNESGSECDFVVLQNEKFEQVIQVCYEITTENSKRELNGLNNAMEFFKTTNGIILTFNQCDAYMYNGKKIEIMPVWQWLTQSI